MPGVKLWSKSGSRMTSRCFPFFLCAGDGIAMVATNSWKSHGNQVVVMIEISFHGVVVLLLVNSVGLILRMLNVKSWGKFSCCPIDRNNLHSSQ